MTQTMEDQTNGGPVPTTTSAEPEAESEIHPEPGGHNTISRVSEDLAEELGSSDPMPKGTSTTTGEGVYSKDRAYKVETREPPYSASRKNSTTYDAGARLQALSAAKAATPGSPTKRAATQSLTSGHNDDRPDSQGGKKQSKPISTSKVAIAVAPTHSSKSTSVNSGRHSVVSGPIPTPYGQYDPHGYCNDGNTTSSMKTVSSIQSQASHNQGWGLPSWGLSSKGSSRLPHEKTIEDLENRLTGAKNDAQTWKKEYESVRIELNKMCDEQEKQAATIRRMQENAFRQFDQAEWMSESNDEIGRKLKTLDSDIKTWCKSFAVPLLSMISTSKDQQDLLTCLSRVARLDNGKIPIGVPDDRAWMLLQARLTYVLYTKVFEEPFFFLGERLSRIKPGADADGRNASIIAEMGDMYNEMASIDRRETYNWRAQMLRLLDPPPRPGHQKERRIANTKRITSTARDRAALECADRFLHEGMSLLIKDPHSETMEKGLQSFAVRAGQMSYSLWVQKKGLKCNTLDELPERFSHDNPLLEAHQLHNKHLNDDPTRLDGLPILVITHPAVLSYGNDDGSDYNVCSVLKKAICWMGEPPKWPY